MTTPKLTTAEVTAANREAWNRSAQFHHENEYWKETVAGLLKGNYSSFDKTLTEVLERVDLKGKAAVQVCCNNGKETLSLKSFGAERCLGIDQSEAFVAQARELNAISKSDCEFSAADVYQLPNELREKFDVALITIGVLNWMPDLPAFFDKVSSLLKAGGDLVIYETHPFLEMYDPHGSDPLKPTDSYFENDNYEDTEIIVYDGIVREGGSVSYWHTHKVSDIINGAIKSGLRIDEFTEYAHSNREVDYDVYENQKAQLPMCFTLTASKT
ncbi:class I SAM-dependent methyltransferase [Alphaproteobacteria bacterium]|nr:class I SAM-dependent methyltransferase [Alphaproteobacteria bacterium]